MSTDLILIITAVVGAIYIYLPKVVSFLFPEASDTQLNNIVELLIKLIETLLNQLSGLTL